MEAIKVNLDDFTELWKQCENVANHYVNEFLLTEPVDIGLIAKNRNVIIRKKKNQSVLGNLSLLESGFEIKTNLESHNKHPYYFRFITAHELAHTFFYYNIFERPVDSYQFAPGEKNLERVCNYLAGCLLCPEILIERFANRRPRPSDFNFSYSVILSGYRRFKVTERIFLNRIVRDLMIWDFPVFKFIKVPFINKKGEPETNWKLKDHFIPQKYSSKLFFIPRGSYRLINRSYDYSKLPTISGKLNRLSENLYYNLPSESIYWFETSYSMLLSHPIKNFIESYKNDFLKISIGAFKAEVGGTPVLYLFLNRIEKDG